MTENLLDRVFDRHNSALLAFTVSVLRRLNFLLDNVLVSEEIFCSAFDLIQPFGWQVFRKSRQDLRKTFGHARWPRGGIVPSAKEACV